MAGISVGLINEIKSAEVSRSMFPRKSNGNSE
jgi:hypothetical protein